MTPEPPPPSDGSALPQRHRPNMDALAKDTTEKELWDLDDDLPAPFDTARPQPRGFKPAPPAESTQPASAVPILNAPRFKARTRTYVERIGRLDTSRRITEKEREISQQSSAMPTPPPAGGVEAAFDDLEHWDTPDEIPNVASAAPASAPDKPDFSSAPADPAPAEEPTEELSPDEPDAGDSPPQAPAPVCAEPAAEANASDDEFTPVPRPAAAPLSLRPKLQLVLMERIGLAVLVVLLLGSGIWIYQNTLHRLSRNAATVRPVKFPVTGQHLTIGGATTYWRAPLSTSDQAERVQRGVVLIPVLELAVTTGTGAVRVFFSDHLGKSIGDPITRAVNGMGTLTIAATGGFDESSLLDAYRTGQTPPWFIRITEAPSADAKGEDFKELAKIQISTDKR